VVENWWERLQTRGGSSDLGRIRKLSLHLTREKVPGVVLGNTDGREEGKRRYIS